MTTSPRSSTASPSTAGPFIVKPRQGLARKADPKQTWSVVDGTIRCTGKPNGCVVTEKEYGDYVLKLKWRFPADSKGGNSGVLAPRAGRQVLAHVG